MPNESMPDTDSLSQSIQAGLAEIRHLLIHTPTSVSPGTIEPLLERVSLDLAQLKQSSPPPAIENLLEILQLSARVQALYLSASSFFNGLTGESVLYSSQGEYRQSAIHNPEARLEARG